MIGLAISLFNMTINLVSMTIGLTVLMLRLTYHTTKWTIIGSIWALRLLIALLLGSCAVVAVPLLALARVSRRRSARRSGHR